MVDYTHYSEISKLKFYILDSDENLIDSSVSITNKELFKDSLPVPNGVYNQHMGTTDHSFRCGTCFNVKNTCPGHSGTIDVRYPVKSPLFRDTILKWLKIVCFKCGSLLLDKDVKAPKAKLLAEYVKLSRDIHHCPVCEEYHPTVKKDKFEQAMFYADYPASVAGHSKREELFNHEIGDILNRITDEVVIKVGKPLESHPNKLILNIIRVPPNTLRPDIRKIGGNRSNNSDTTALLKNIVEINEQLPMKIPDKHEINKNLREIYFNLDMTYYEMIKGSPSTNNQVRLITSTNKTPNSIAQRIPKKSGRIRKNLMGRLAYIINKIMVSLLQQAIFSNCGNILMNYKFISIKY